MAKTKDVRIDLGSMSLKELQQHQRDVAAAIVQKEKAAFAEAVEKVRATAAEYGLRLEDIISSESKKSRKKMATSVAKYRNPKNADQTWTGKGRQPSWFKDAVEAGTEPDDMLIN